MDFVKFVLIMYSEKAIDIKFVKELDFRFL